MRTRYVKGSSELLIRRQGEEAGHGRVMEVGVDAAQDCDCRLAPDVEYQSEKPTGAGGRIQ
jgi:hypothetical protein